MRDFRRQEGNLRPIVNRPESGVTLIEILIAVTLLSLLSGGVLLAMRIGFNTMDKTDSRLVRNRRVTNARQIIENEIAGFISTRAEFEIQPGARQQVPFLQAEAASLRFVTSYSLDAAWRGRAQIAEIQVIPAERNAGFRLILNEIPYTGPFQAGQTILGIEQQPGMLPVTHFKPIEPSSRSFVLADRLAYCRFFYLEPRTEPPFQIWRQDWPNWQRWPQGIRIEMAPLDTFTTDLHVTTVTMPFNVNGAPNIHYSDQL